MGKKIYVIARGKKPGVYHAWAGAGQAHEQVKGFAGARFKSFAAAGPARRWLEGIEGHDPAVLDALNRLDAERADGSDHRKHLEDGRVVIYTDGGCSGNPGPGGYGCVTLDGETRTELSGGYRETTNNRMELMACIVGLEALEPESRVTLFSDSKYVVEAITKGWARRWRARGWMRTPTEPARNPDLWKRLLEVCERHDVEFRWVKGHAGTEENERCDELAVEATGRPDLPADPGYPAKPTSSLF